MSCNPTEEDVEQIDKLLEMACNNQFKAIFGIEDLA